MFVYVTVIIQQCSCLIKKSQRSFTGSAASFTFDTVSYKLTTEIMFLCNQESEYVLPTLCVNILR